MHARNLEALTTVYETGLYADDATSDDKSIILDRWTFPLYTLDLSRRTVTDEELRATRERGEAQLMREYGYFEY